MSGEVNEQCRSVPIADALLRQLHSWLASPKTALFSRQLLATVKTAMTKTFLQLLAEIKALDAIIISASFSSLILATRKHNIQAANAYVSFLVKTLATRDLFKWLLLVPNRAWLTLLWRDRFNYAGLAVHSQLSVAQGTTLATAYSASGGSETGKEEDTKAQSEGLEAAYEAQWNLRDFLPPALAKYFDDIVQRFVTRPWHAISANRNHAVRHLRCCHACQYCGDRACP
jgi:hypothetical protein